LLWQLKSVTHAFSNPAVAVRSCAWLVSTCSRAFALGSCAPLLTGCTARAGVFEPILLVDTLIKRGLDLSGDSAATSGYTPSARGAPSFPVPTNSTAVYLSPTVGTECAGEELVVNGTATRFAAPTAPLFITTLDGFTIVLRYRLVAVPSLDRETILHLSDVPDPGGVFPSSSSLKVLRLGGMGGPGRIALHWARGDKATRAAAVAAGGVGGSMYVESEELQAEEEESTIMIRLLPAGGVAGAASLHILRNGTDVTVRALRAALPCLARAPALPMPMLRSGFRSSVQVSRGTMQPNFAGEVIQAGIAQARTRSAGDSTLLKQHPTQLGYSSRRGSTDFHEAPCGVRELRLTRAHGLLRLQCTVREVAICTLAVGASSWADLLCRPTQW
jgi:hypothetical protein